MPRPQSQRWSESHTDVMDPGDFGGMRGREDIFVMYTLLTSAHPAQAHPLFFFFFFKSLGHPLFLKNIYLFIWLRRVLVPACGLPSCNMHVGSGSLTRDRTQVPCIGSSESYPLRHQESPCSSPLNQPFIEFWILE